MSINGWFQYIDTAMSSIYSFNGIIVQKIKRIASKTNANMVRYLCIRDNTREIL
jgi:hypothetical protein